MLCSSLRHGCYTRNMISTKLSFIDMYRFNFARFVSIVTSLLENYTIECIFLNVININ